MTKVVSHNLRHSSFVVRLLYHLACMASRTYLPLIERYPLNGETRLSCGAAPTPYLIYDGYGVFVGGTADVNVVRRLLAHETVTPLCDTYGRALMGVWAIDFTEASLGPHHEVQVSFLVTRQESAPVKAGRLAAAEAMVTRPEIRLFCHGLWNSTPLVVAYNSEHLGLPARLAENPVTRSNGRLRVNVPAEIGASIVSGDIGIGRASLRATFEFMQRLGFARAQRVANEPWVEMKVVNPIGRRPRNDAAQAATHNAVNALRLFDPNVDTLTLSGPDYGGLEFQPAYIQVMDGITFIYLDPASDE